MIRPDLRTPDRWLLERAGSPDSLMRTTDESERLLELMAPRAVIPIAVVREPGAYPASMQAALSRAGYSEHSTDTRSVAYTEPDSWLVDHESLVRTLRDVAAGGSVHVIDHDAETREPGSIIPALAARIGVPRDELYPGWDRRVNVTPVVRAGS